VNYLLNLFFKVTRSKHKIFGVSIKAIEEFFLSGKTETKNRQRGLKLGRGRGRGRGIGSVKCKGT
jgi:hypothetical protein